MRHKDTELMQKIADYAEQYYFANRKSPSTTQIAKAVGIARGTAYKYLTYMSEQGMISYDGEDILTQKRMKVSAPSKPSGVMLEGIPCGPLETIDATVDAYVELPSAIFGDAETFILRAVGNSMIEADIHEGDLVVVRKQQTAQDGDIVVALVDNANTLKRLKYDHQLCRYYLHPENAALSDIYVDNLAIQGVAKFIIKGI